MRRKFLLGLSMLMAAAYALAGSASEQFSVKITLNAGSASAASCVSSSTSSSSNASVQVRCSSNVFVAIGPATTTRTLQLVSAFQPSRSSASPDICPDSLSGSDTAEAMACQSGDHGMVTMLAIPYAERRFGPVEMLVSF